MAQWAICLPCQHEHMSLDLETIESWAQQHTHTQPQQHRHLQSQDSCSEMEKS